MKPETATPQVASVGLMVLYVHEETGHQQAAVITNVIGGANNLVNLTIFYDQAPVGLKFASIYEVNGVVGGTWHFMP